MALPERPEPMNAITSHSKVKVSIMVSDPTFVAGKFVSGKMEMECRADKGLGIGVIMVELFGIQELSSRDHSATSTFFHAKRLFQGPGLPPSNAVQAFSEPGDPPLPSHHYPARRGISTFLFRIPLPVTSPSSVNFGGGLACVKYELRASASVSWRDDKRLVTERKSIDVVEGLDDDALAEYLRGNGIPSIAVGENGKLWMQGIIVGGGMITAGESACVELQVKNHSAKKNNALTLSLTRHLVLPNIPADKQPLQITDTLANVPFRGPEYIIQPGVEGVANLVFDIPKTARGVKGGSYEDETEIRTRVTPSIFEVQCIVSVKMGMGIGNKDLVLNIPVTVVSPLAIPHDLVLEEVSQSNTGEIVPYPGPQYTPYYPPITAPPPPALLSPMFTPYAEYDRVWFPPPSQSPLPFHYLPPVNPLYIHMPPPPRPASVLVSSHSQPTISGLPATTEPHPLLPLNLAAHYESLQQQQWNVDDLEPEEGKGERASRVTLRLHLSSRHRSLSPQSHRFPLPRSSSGQPITTTEEPVFAWTLPVPSAPFMPASPHHEMAEKLPSLPTSSPVHSPRPVLSPRLSHLSLRSERVEELERLVAEADEDDVVARRSSTSRKRKKGSRKGKEKAVIDLADINKTLPPPPVPTRKGFLAPPQHDSSSDPAGVIDVVPDNVAQSPILSILVAADKAPPTPTITAVTPVRHSRSNLTERIAAERFESGLDALEKRLLEEVGTKKIDRLFSPPHAQRIFESPPANAPPIQASPTRGRLSPIKIPLPRTSNTADDDELKIDSAISSLTLADGGLALGAGRQERDGAEREADPRLHRESAHEHEHDDSDERTHKAGTVGRKSKSKSSLSGEDGQEEHGKEVAHKRESDMADSRGRREGVGKEKKRGKKKDGFKRRKSVKGRVTAWLGAIDPDALPPEDDLLEGSFPTPGVLHHHSTASLVQVQDVQSESGPAIPTSAPNPRSSGFMPIGTQKRDMKRTSSNTLVADNTGRPAVNQTLGPTSLANTPEKPAGQSPEIKPPVAVKLEPMSAAQPQKTSASDDRGDKLQEQRKHRAVETAVNEPTKDPAPISSSTRQLKQPHTQHDGPRSPISVPAKSRSQDPGAKYDVKSARGGRGGLVTAITAFWSSAAAKDASNVEVPNRTKVSSTGNPPRKQAAPRAITKPIPAPSTSKPTTPDIQPARRATPQLRGVNKAQFAPSEPSPRLLGIAGKSKAATKSPVPAVISSSLATPMLSTTASLVRPPIPQLKSPMMSNSNNTSPAETPRLNGPVKAKSTPDLSFGKARLHDLIKKYQERGS